LLKTKGNCHHIHYSIDITKQFISACFHSVDHARVARCDHLILFLHHHHHPHLQHHPLHLLVLFHLLLDFESIREHLQKCFDTIKMRKKTLVETPMKQFLTKKKDGWMVLQSSLPDRVIHSFIQSKGHARLQTELSLSQAARGLCLLSEQTQTFFKVACTRQSIQLLSHHATGETPSLQTRKEESSQISQTGRPLAVRWSERRR